MARSRRQQRRLSNVSNSSSSSTSPEREVDDDNDSLMLQGNDSQSSIAVSIDLMANDHFEERCRVSPVYRLPAELMIGIFARLSSTKDLMSCMLVSKDWARNSVALLWHRPQTNNWSSVQTVVKSVRKSDRTFAYQDLVKRLNLSTLASQVSDGTIYGLTSCKRIERLTLTNCTKLTDLSLIPLIEGNRSLVALDMTQLDQVSDRTLDVVARNCVRLQGLNMTGCRRLTDQSVVQIANNCRHLKRLKCNSCSQLTDLSMLSVAQNSSHLLEIDLYDLPLLESDSITAILTKCKQLRELRLARCPRITDQAFLQVPLKCAPLDALRILDLTDCQELTDKAIERIVQTCPKLRNLILAKCRQLTDRAVWSITKLSRNLHYIHLGHCARITDASIIALAKACTRIRYIDLACCSNLTDHSITQLANLPKLKRVGLVKCAGITDRSIHALATYGGRALAKPRDRQQGVSALERVHLSYCTLLTLDGIHTLLNNCPRLTHLSLTGVQAFLRDDLTVFCREAPAEFNDHQREVFCVFSGNGVSRLREYLNGAGGPVLETGMVNDSDEETDTPLGPPPPPPHHNHNHHWHQPPAFHNDMEDEDMEDDMDGTLNDVMDAAAHGHTINLDVHSTPANDPGHMMSTSAPASNWIHPMFQNLVMNNQGVGGLDSGSGSGISTPSGTGGGMPWTGVQDFAQRGEGSLFGGSVSQSGGLFGGGVGLGQQGGNGGSGTTAGNGEAQHVTGMMSAAILDDVDDVGR